ncbi:hypothetical protein LR48_Vigan538s001400 [Vigna angularis]|uniref:Uncharacterized protein n=1 Tax=Phaseolus angularis TaxID=3914 RepID=A0A0L9TD96_PHAAN|nr:hypothetical protein LR48_Vigan538s001400 [Vigna angularis]
MTATTTPSANFGGVVTSVQVAKEEPEQPVLDSDTDIPEDAADDLEIDAIKWRRTPKLEHLKYWKAHGIPAAWRKMDTIQLPGAVTKMKAARCATVGRSIQVTSSFEQRDAHDDGLNIHTNSREDVHVDGWEQKKVSRLEHKSSALHHSSTVKQRCPAGRRAWRMHTLEEEQLPPFTLFYCKAHGQQAFSSFKCSNHKVQREKGESASLSVDRVSESDDKNGELKENAGVDIKECTINEGEYTATSLSELEKSILVSHTRQLLVEGGILLQQFAMKRKKKHLAMDDRAMLMKQFFLKFSLLNPEMKNISLLVQVWKLPP